MFLNNSRWEQLSDEGTYSRILTLHVSITVIRSANRTFELEPCLESDEDLSFVRFKASVVITREASPSQAMLIMSPDANSLNDLRNMNMTLSDLPVHGAHRDAVFLREHLSTQMNNALRMEKLTKSLETEKSLLESLLPIHAANGLREGKKVEPMMHNNVTMFFSDIVGFTDICKQIKPHDVIVLLNRLYCIMDYLASKFGLYKIETVGDAYVCCSGLPRDDYNHAENVANFAIAVSHCGRLVPSPLDGDEPIQLRIGIHTGECASGIVGTVNPRYCVFGDTVNTTARHETTGRPGLIHCSHVTRDLLEERSGDMYSLAERGLVEMKGKGQQLTYWLSATEDNPLVNSSALQELEADVTQLLKKTNFDNIKTSYSAESKSPSPDEQSKERKKKSSQHANRKMNLSYRPMKQFVPERLVL